MAKKYRFKCPNKFGADACELGMKPYPENVVEFTLEELSGQRTPKCPKGPHPLQAIDKLPPQPGSQLGAGGGRNRSTTTISRPWGRWIAIAGVVLATVIIVAVIRSQFSGKKERSSGDLWAPLDEYYRSSSIVTTHP